jgi:hypothetical protein
LVGKGEFLAPMWNNPHPMRTRLKTGRSPLEWSPAFLARAML